MNCAHRHWEETSKIVLPVISSCNDNPLFHAVVLDGAYIRSHIKICYVGCTKKDVIQW